MRRKPDRQERRAGLLVVVGSAMVFTPAIWLVQRWSEAVARDPSDAWGARWLGEHLMTNPYLTVAVVLLSILLSSGVVMLIIVRVAKGLAAWLTGRGQPPAPEGREVDS